MEQLTFLAGQGPDMEAMKGLRDPYAFDRALMKWWKGGFIGVDEAGRGPLAGPVVAAAVVLGEASAIPNLRDSKKVGPAEREELSARIRTEAGAFAVAFVGPGEIDEMNILNASLLAMKQAVLALHRRLPVVVDGNRTIPGIPNEQIAVVKGDARSASVAAASILAKVARDAHMMNMSREYPQYGFEGHKGYPTREHLERIRSHGPCPIHRKTFKGVLV